MAQQFSNRIVAGELRFYVTKQRNLILDVQLHKRGAWRGARGLCAEL